MPKRAQIQCINKSDRYNPWERIINVGGVGGDGKRWRIAQQDAIIHIETREWDFFVKQRVHGVDHEVDVVVAISAWGNKYIKTKPDGDSPDNLLSLPECPPQ